MSKRKQSNSSLEPHKRKLQTIGGENPHSRDPLSILTLSFPNLHYLFPWNKVLLSVLPICVSPIFSSVEKRSRAYKHPIPIQTTVAVP